MRITANHETIKEIEKKIIEKNPNGIGVWDAFECACRYGMNNEVTELLKAGIDPNNNYEERRSEGSLGRTPLAQACRGGHLSIVELLLEHGANTALCTPILFACIGANKVRTRSSNTTYIDIVKKLIEKGANVNDITEKYSQPPLKCALNNLEMMKVLLKANANPNLKEKRYFPNGFFASIACSNNTKSAFLQACLEGKHDAVTLLLNSGAQVNSTDSNNYTPLMYAVIRGDIELVKILLKNGARETIDAVNWVTPDIKVNGADGGHNSALMFANKGIFDQVWRNFHREGIHTQIIPKVKVYETIAQILRKSAQSLSVTSEGPDQTAKRKTVSTEDELFASTTPSKKSKPE